MSARCFRGSCVVGQVQTEELPNWKARVRRKALRKRRASKQRQQDFDPTTAVPSEALLWKGEPWKKHRRDLASVQMQIYRAVRRGDDPTALQATLCESEAAKKLSVRRVASTHPQRRLPGVDGVHSLESNAQAELAQSTRLDGSSDDFRFLRTERAWRELRTEASAPERICVCTMRDRVKQVLLSWALEPELEARFARTNILSHRPGRAPSDYADWIRGACGVDGCRVWAGGLEVGDAERIGEFLAGQLRTPLAGTQLRSWVRSGLFELGLFPAGIGRHGEEQSCPILPLLSNLLSHHLLTEVQKRPVAVDLASWNGTLVVASNSTEDLSSVQGTLEKTASEIGLSVWTDVAGALCSEDWIQLHQFSFRQERRCGEGAVVVQPGEGVLEAHLDNLLTAFRLSQHFLEDKAGLINRLNPIIESFRDHYWKIDVTDCFAEADAFVRDLLILWSMQHNPSLSETEALEKEFHKDWKAEPRPVFRTRIGRLLWHGDPRPQSPPLHRRRSPYDGDSAFWKGRLKKWDCHIRPSLL